LGNGGVDLIGVEQVEFVKVLSLLLEHHQVWLANPCRQYCVHLQVENDLLLHIFLLENVLIVLGTGNYILELIQVVPQSLLYVLILELVIRLSRN
jgi:hypothetical protein